MENLYTKYTLSNIARMSERKCTAATHDRFYCRVAWRKVSSLLLQIMVVTPSQWNYNYSLSLELQMSLCLVIYIIGH